MSRVLLLSALLVAGAVQAIVARSQPGGEPAAREPDAPSATWVARFADEPDPDAPPLRVPMSSIPRFGSGLDGDGPMCLSSALVASAGSANVALARSALLRFGSGLEGDVPACASGRWAAATASSSREAAGNTASLRFGSGLDDDARARGPSVLLQSGLEGLASKAAPREVARADRFGSGLEDHAQALAPNELLESGL
jgi:hypothetical protein